MAIELMIAALVSKIRCFDYGNKSFLLDDEECRELLKEYTDFIRR